MKKIIIFSMFALIISAAVPVFADDVIMTMNTKDAAGVLNHLIERAIDGQKGFTEAAERTASADLKARFNARSEERGKFARELQEKVITLGQEAEKTGSVPGKLHRAWIDVKSAVRTDDDKAVLAAVKTGEGKALEDYREALNQNLPSEIRGVIEKQSKEIQSSYDWTIQKLGAMEGKDGK